MSKTYAVRAGLTDAARKKLEAYSDLLAHLLFHRGITGGTQAERFLHPDYENHVHDPFLLADMERAVARIIRALETDEKIVIYSDYDCDGIPGAVLMHDFFELLGYPHFQNYIPHRHEEGYGLNTEAIDRLVEDGAQLMITVDCGITDVTQVAHANEKGLDVIITDHHLPRLAEAASEGGPRHAEALGEGGPAQELPPALAVINPNRADCTYPFGGLSGTGVAFKLVQAILQRLQPTTYNLKPIPKGQEKWLLDMVGLATVADMVPLRDENRVLAHYGLKVLRKSRRPGLHKLCSLMRVNQNTFTEDDIGFMLAPRINAASRMDVPMDAFHTLAQSDPTEANRYAQHLHKINDRRKGVVAAMVKEMHKKVTERDELPDVLVLGNPKWKPSLLGLAANTLAEAYLRPVFLWGREGGSGELLKGSCRSDGHVRVIDLMEGAGDVLAEFGGHAFSGGFSIAPERVHELEPALVKVLRENGGSKMSEQIAVDLKLSVRDVSWETYKDVERLAPFGEGNPKPLFLLEDATVASVEQFGKEKNHLRIEITDGQAHTAQAIGFFMHPEQFGVPLKPDTPVNLVATMEKSLFAGRRELRLRIVDIF